MAARARRLVPGSTQCDASPTPVCRGLRPSASGLSAAGRGSAPLLVGALMLVGSAPGVPLEPGPAKMEEALLAGAG